MMIRLKTLFATVLLALIALPPLAHAGDSPGMGILKQQCISCHNIAGPAPQSLKSLWNRKGPDLFYAGNKYRQQWIEDWLQKPQRIRPAGMFFMQHIKPGEKRDMIDPSGLAKHVALSAIDAASVAKELMKLKPHDALIAKESVPEGSISMMMGEMVFAKFNDCLACHQIEPGYGGLSGPELYTAAKRLQPLYIASYLRNPQAWDTKIWMPNNHISDANIKKLIYYMQGLAKENWDEK